MATIKKQLKTTAFFLTALLLFQSCVVYQKAPTTLEQASREQVMTKITYTNGETAKYNYITFEDGVFYGVNNDWDERGALTKTRLTGQESMRVFTKNKSASTWLTVGIIAVPAVILAGVLAGQSVNPSPF